MDLDLVGYDRRVKDAVQIFWGSRAEALQKQLARGVQDRGGRAQVTSGKNMDGFVELLIELVRRNGLGEAEIHQNKAALTLPGYFRPTKLWDIVVTFRGSLVAVIELKSQVGPSFGNNYNNRVEEAIGSGLDFWTAFRKGAFGKQNKPFLGWLILVEDIQSSRKPVKSLTPHYAISEDFRDASYLDRYNIFCRRLVEEQLYTSACLIASPKSARTNGAYSVLSPETEVKKFVQEFASHIRTTAGRRNE